MNLQAADLVRSVAFPAQIPQPSATPRVQPGTRASSRTNRATRPGGRIAREGYRSDMRGGDAPDFRRWSVLHTEGRDDARRERDGLAAVLSQLSPDLTIFPD